LSTFLPAKTIRDDFTIQLLTFRIMKLTKAIFLYLMAASYFAAGVTHLIKPAKFLIMMPHWLPFHIGLIYLSGVAEIIFAILLIPFKTRALAAWLIIAMLVIYFFVIHIPQSIDFYQTGNKYFMITLIRLPLQFLLIGWAWIYTQKQWRL
jgi:uncharacterized membrane protein